jgi:hypothetical protein
MSTPEQLSIESLIHDLVKQRLPLMLPWRSCGQNCSLLI